VEDVEVDDEVPSSRHWTTISHVVGVPPFFGRARVGRGGRIIYDRWSGPPHAFHPANKLASLNNDTGDDAMREVHNDLDHHHHRSHLDYDDNNNHNNNNL